VVMGPAKKEHNHRITGDQHALNMFSLLTDKCIYVGPDQISCKKCSTKITEYLKETGKSAIHVQPGEVDLAHEGVCHRNSTHGPTNAEEFACEEAGKILLDLPDMRQYSVIYLLVMATPRVPRNCSLLKWGLSAA
jgi:hypothetical protein